MGSPSGEIGPGKLSSPRPASTDVLFSLRQLWYLHAIVRCSGCIQNSSCVDLVRSWLLRDFIGPLQRSVHTVGWSFGGSL